MSGGDGSGVKSAERALTILELFSHRERALTFTEVAALLGYPRSSLHGLLHTLTDRGWLQHDAATRRFSLGIRAWEAGSAYRPAADLARHAAPVVEKLGRVVAGEVHLSLLDGTDTVRVIDSGDHAGARTPAHASGPGRVLLASLEPGERALHLVGVAVDADELQRGLDQVRGDGWADDDGAGELRSLGVPIRDAHGKVVAALGVVAPAPHLAAERREDALRALQRGAEQISSALGSPAPS